MRSFIAAELSPEIIERVTELQKELPQQGLKLVEKDNIHITLKFLGEIDDKTKDKVIEKIEKCALPKFSVKCSSIGVFPSIKFIRVVWVGIESSELVKLGDCLNDGLSALGFKKEHFSPHMTIARVKDRANLNSILIKHEKTFFGECEITEIKLKKSTLTPNGPVYETIHTCKLL